MRIRRSLIDLDDLSAEELAHIFERTAEFERKAPGPLLAGQACVNMFFEESTRTFTSFNLAELRLGADVVNLAPAALSLATKGETIEDTAITLGAMGVRVLVIRHPTPGFPQSVASSFRRPRDQRRRRWTRASDAGAARYLHLDRRVRRTFRPPRRDRRVTFSIAASPTRRCAAWSGSARRSCWSVPESFLPDDYAVNGIGVERDFDSILPNVDAVVLLRIQRERFAEMPISDQEYVAAYRLDERRLASMRKEAIVMHPGPYNRGMELDDCVLNWAGWRYARQVHHGVAVRMAVLDLLVNNQ